MYFCVRAFGSTERGVVFLVWFTSGVIQGCPMSGLLFVAAVDPMLTEMHKQLDAKNKAVTRACADDIAAALRDRAASAVYHHSFSVARKSHLSYTQRQEMLVGAFVGPLHFATGAHPQGLAKCLGSGVEIVWGC